MANLRKTEFPVRLNKYISNSGYCARRKADELIKKGSVKINDLIILNPFYRVQKFDIVKIYNKIIIQDDSIEQVYIILNKPKDYIVTQKDEFSRKTVFELLKDFNKNVRLFPVGRLDRNTTGALLLTNDGQLSNAISHPSGNIIKIYKVTIDKKLVKSDMVNLIEGIYLEDGISSFDTIKPVNNIQGNVYIVTLHSGKNRIIKRTFEKLDYHVKHLDRVSFAGIETKKLARGQWRYLNTNEIQHLKIISKML